MRELIYYVATSLDGFIARKDGSFDDFDWDEVVSDFLSDLENFGTVLMGRKTYEVGLREGKTSPYPNMRQILFSRTMKASPSSSSSGDEFLGFQILRGKIRIRAKARRKFRDSKAMHVLAF